MVGACHEGVVVRSVAQDDELGTAERVPVGCQRGCLENYIAHEAHSVHVDTRLRRADIDTRADALCHSHGLGDGADEKLVTMCHALGDNGRVSTEEIDPDILGSAVEGLGDGDIVSRDMAARRADKGDGGDGDALVDNGDGKLARDGLACLHKVAGEGRYAGVYVLARLLERAVSAREEGYAHGYRADIKILLLYHLVGL